METAVVTTLELGKQDERGRRLAKKGERAALLAAFRSSGLTQRGFARREGINPFTFCNWLRKERSKSAAPVAEAVKRPKPPRFLEVGVRSSPGFALEVVLPGGVIIRGGDLNAVVSLAKELR